MNCEICGISDSTKPIRYSKKANMYLCNKHDVQFRLNGKFLDNNPHSRKDPNTYRIMENYIEVDCYNNKGEITDIFICDLDDLHFIQEHNWRVAIKRNKHYIVTGNNRNFPITYFHRLVMNYTGELEIDHIDGNTLNNRKSNLRIADRNIQCMNLKPKYTNKIGVRGISKDSRYNNYIVDFTAFGKRIYIKQFYTIEEAVYARYLLELKYNPARYTENDDYIFSFINKLTPQQKIEIEQYIHDKTYNIVIKPFDYI